MVGAKYLYENGHLFKPQSVSVDAVYVAQALCGCNERHTSGRMTDEGRAREMVANMCKNCSNCRYLAKKAIEQGASAK